MILSGVQGTEGEGTCQKLPMQYKETKKAPMTTGSNGVSRGDGYWPRNSVR